MHYNKEQEKLTVVYLSGAVYDYLKVPDEVYTEMIAARSKGTYLNKNIKGKYTFVKVA